MSRTDEHWDRLVGLPHGAVVLVAEPCEIMVIGHTERLVLPVGARIQTLSVSRLALLGVYTFLGRKLTVCVKCPDFGRLEPRWLPSEWRARTPK